MTSNAKIEVKLINILNNLIGRKFFFNELAEALEIDSEILLDIFLNLQNQNEIELASFPDGTLRVSRVHESNASAPLSKPAARPSGC